MPSPDPPPPPPPPSRRGRRGRGSRGGTPPWPRGNKAKVESYLSPSAKLKEEIKEEIENARATEE